MALNERGVFDSMMKPDKNGEPTIADQAQVGRLFTLMSEAVFRLRCYWLRDHPSVKHLQQKDEKILLEIAGEIYLALTGQTIPENKPTSGDEENTSRYRIVVTNTTETLHLAGFNRTTGEPELSVPGVLPDITFPNMKQAYAAAQRVTLELPWTARIDITKVPKGEA